MLILAASSFRHAITSPKGAVSLVDLPRKAHDELGLRGLLLPTDLLAGADARRLDTLRERADKTSCPCLYLVETQAHPLATNSRDDAAASLDRLDRVLQAAHRLGCSAAGISVSAPDNDPALEAAAERLKPLAGKAERLDLSLLLCPYRGLTETPERISDLLKKIGGFRVGLLPDFKEAAASGDGPGYLRRLAPYAPVVLATSGAFDETGRHTGYSLEECAASLVAVGYEGAVALACDARLGAEAHLQRMRRTLEPILFGEGDVDDSDLLADALDLDAADDEPEDSQ